MSLQHPIDKADALIEALRLRLVLQCSTLQALLESNIAGVVAEPGLLCVLPKLLLLGSVGKCSICRPLLKCLLLCRIGKACRLRRFVGKHAALCGALPKVLRLGLIDKPGLRCALAKLLPPRLICKLGLRRLLSEVLRLCLIGKASQC